MSKSKAALLPQDIEAEEAVLSSILMDSDAIGQIAETLAPDDFFRDAHHAIFEAACDLHAARKPLDLVTICDELTQRGKLEDVGGAAYISGLSGQAPSAHRVKHYAEIVARTATLRRLIAASGEIAATAYSNQDALEALGHAEKTIAEVRAHAERSTSAKEPRFKLLSDDEIMNLEPAAGVVGNILFEDTIAFLYAREGRWKTFLALDWAMCCSSDRSWHGRHVTAGPAVYIAAEGAHGIGKRIAAWKRHHEVYEPTAIKVLGRPVQLLDAGEVHQLVADIRVQVGDSNPVLVVIDTLARSMIGGDENSARDINAVTAAAYAIKEAFGCCVLVVHHTGKDDARGLRGSSALRSNADTIIRVASGDDNEPRIEPGARVTVKCEKTKDDAPFADITLTAHVVTVARKSGVTFDSLVLIPAEPATVRAATPKLTANQQKALDTLYQKPDTIGMRNKEWMKATGLPERSFNDALKALRYQFEYITYEEVIPAYIVTAKGAEHVSPELRNDCDRTANGDIRTANGAEGAENENPEFMDAEATAKVRAPIGVSQFRSSEVDQDGFADVDTTGNGDAA